MLNEVQHMATSEAIADGRPLPRSRRGSREAAAILTATGSLVRAIRAGDLPAQPSALETYIARDRLRGVAQPTHRRISPMTFFGTIRREPTTDGVREAKGARPYGTARDSPQADNFTEIHAGADRTRPARDGWSTRRPISCGLGLPESSSSGVDHPDHDPLADVLRLRGWRYCRAHCHLHPSVVVHRPTGERGGRGAMSHTAIITQGSDRGHHDEPRRPQAGHRAVPTRIAETRVGRKKPGVATPVCVNHGSNRVIGHVLELMNLDAHGVARGLVA